MKIYSELPSELKVVVNWLAVLLLVGLVLSAFAFAYSQMISGWMEKQDVTKVRQLNVTGEGKVALKPDVAIFTASVVTEAKKVGDAQDENTVKSNAVANYLKSQGVADKDLKTINYSITPQYQYYSEPLCTSSFCPPRRPPQIVSYQVRNTLEVKVRDLGKVDDLLGGVVKNGANEVGSVAFDIDDKEAARAQAREKAIENAKEKAEVLARSLGVRLGKVVNFSESNNGVPIYGMSYGALGKGGGVMAASPEVQPGEQEITSNVNINYEFR